MLTSASSTVMVVESAGLEVVTSSPTVTPVGCVYQLESLTNVSQTPRTTTVLSAWRTSTPVGWRHTSPLLPLIAPVLLPGHGEDRTVCLSYLWTVHAGHEHGLGQHRQGGGQHSHAKGVWYKKTKVSPQARALLSKSSEESDFNKREEIFQSYRDELCIEFRF